jgi:hypothetical protein
MPLGRSSSDKLALCPRPIILLITTVAADVDAGLLLPLVRDTTVICTFRNEKDQTAAYTARPQRSKKPWPTSGHNHMPPLAVDFLPYPLAWDDWEKDDSPLWLLQGYTRARAKAMGIPLKPAIRWDAPHYELDQP